MSYHRVPESRASIGSAGSRTTAAKDNYDQRNIAVGDLRFLDLYVIFIYAIAMILIGWWCSRRQTSTEEYFVAGRGISPVVVGLSLAATLLSTISYLATPGEMIKNGPGLMWSIVHLPLTFCIVGFLIIPRIMAHKITSAYELLEHRFGTTLRQTSSVLFLGVRLLWMGFIVFTCAEAVATITGLHLYYLLAIVGVCATIYTIVGGIRAVLITDVVQFLVLFGGALLAIGYVTYRFGGLGWWPDWDTPELASLNWKEVNVFSLNPFDRVTAVNAIVATTMWWVCTATSDQVVVQRYLCTEDAKAARKSLRNCILADALITLTLYILGIALLGLFLRFPGELMSPQMPIVDQADKLFPHFIGTILPPGITGLVTAAVFAVAMSSIDSGISAIGSVLMTDFKGLFTKGCGYDQRRLLRRAKWLGLGIGLVAIVLSYTNFWVRRASDNIMEMSARVSSFFVVPMFTLFAMTFFVKFSTPAGAWAAIVSGFLAGVLFSYWNQIVGFFMKTGDFSFVLIMPLSFACSITAGVIVSLFTRPRVHEME